MRAPTRDLTAPPVGLPTAGRLLAGPRWLRARIEENVAAHGLVYPWWIPAISGVALTTCAVVSLGLRGDLWPPYLLGAMVVLVMVPGIVQVIVGRHFPHVIETAGVIAAAALLLANPVDGPGAFDPAPALLALLTAEVVARDGVRNGLFTALTGTGVVVLAALGPGLNGLPVHLVDIMLGFTVGYMLLWQMRALMAERDAREGERARATLAERERIAREIHDLVAHSLSVTLLQITGARHALRDLEASEQVDEVDEALADAERVGRRAMADIRQTVSTLSEGAADLHALPGAADIAGLVDQMSRAGLAVSYAQIGDPAKLAQATGLGVYRIAQESLANIAKHAPESGAAVEFTVTPTRARLLIRNRIDERAGDVRRDVRRDVGSGLAGMRARADQLGATLTAGPEGGEWLVDLRMRLRERDGVLWCPLARKAFG